jgi:hypothetical protein
MKKIKINATTSDNDIKNHLLQLKKLNVNEIPLNDLLRICDYLGAKRLQTTGSSIRFYHEALKTNQYLHGIFTVHKIHKGGNKDLIRKRDFTKFMLPSLLIILESRR